MSLRRFATASLFALGCVLPSLGATAQTTPDPGTEPRIIKAVGDRKGGAAGLGDRVVVTVRNFPALLAKANGNCSAIVLFLDTLPLRKMPPESCNQYEGTVRYLLDRVPDGNDEEWHRLLGSPNGFDRKVRLGVGADDQFAYPTDVTAFPLLVIPAGRFYIFLVLFALLLFSFIQLCRKSSMIRASTTAGPGMPPYSLSRFQMAWWFFLVIAGYVFVWLITWELDTITDSILALMGIGAGTALGAALIDTSPAGTATSTTVAATPSSETVTSVTAPVPSAPPDPSQGFMLDILSDAGGGVSIHRFQMFAWTLILGVIFVASVYKDLSMPEFSATLLGLMGISSGTYLGFKVPEKKQADQAAAAGAPQ